MHWGAVAAFAASPSSPPSSSSSSRNKVPSPPLPSPPPPSATRQQALQPLRGGTKAAPRSMLTLRSKASCGREDEAPDTGTGEEGPPPPRLPQDGACIIAAEAEASPALSAEEELASFSLLSLSTRGSRTWATASLAARGSSPRRGSPEVEEACAFFLFGKEVEGMRLRTATAGRRRHASLSLSPLSHATSLPFSALKAASRTAPGPLARPYETRGSRTHRGRPHRAQGARPRRHGGGPPRQRLMLRERPLLLLLLAAQPPPPSLQAVLWRSSISTAVT